MALHPDVFCPHHNGEKSAFPLRSEAFRKTAIAAAATGNGGALEFMYPNSHIARFTMLRAGLPVNMFVTAVSCAVASWISDRWMALVVVSGQSKYAVPTWTQMAPSSKAARTAHESLMPPAATIGILVVRTSCGTSASVPTCVATSSDRNIPRCPPASHPCAIIPSTPRSRSHAPSATVVAEARTFDPHDRTCFNNSTGGRPK